MRIVIVIVSLAILISGCSNASANESDKRKIETTLHEQYGELLNDIDKITIRNGQGTLTEIDDADIIKQWIHDVSYLPLPIDNETDGSVGFLYGINLYSSSNELVVNFSTEHVNDYLLEANPNLVNAIKDSLP